MFFAYSAEARGNPLLLGVDQTASARQPGGNMEGKEVRFGIANSALFATVTTDASCGAVNAMHDSFTPLGGMVPLVNIMLGEVVFGGVGSGLYGMIVFVILSVFIAGLMVGTHAGIPGKKDRGVRREDGHAVGADFPAGDSDVHGDFGGLGRIRNGFGISNPGPHGLSQILYAYTSGTGNNGSAFGGFNGNTLWYNTTIGFAMLFGRFFMVIPILAIAGSLARKKIRAGIRRHISGDYAAIQFACWFSWF